MITIRNALGAVAGSLLGIMATAAATPPANAGVILQDSGPLVSAIFFFDPIGQSFTAEDEHVSIALSFQRLNIGQPNDPLRAQLLLGAGLAGPILQTIDFSLPPVVSVDFFDLDFSAASLSIGQEYTIAVSAPSDSALWGVLHASADVYAGGSVFLAGGLDPEENFFGDLRFRVTPVSEPASQIPEPASLAFLIGGLLGLNFMRRCSSFGAG